MLRRLIYFSILSIFIFSCKSPEARHPIKSQSGTFIKESADRNKKIYEEEKDYSKSLIAQDSSKNYFSSDKGFWYYYNVKDTTVSDMPDFGDVVQFTYDIKEL